MKIKISIILLLCFVVYANILAQSKENIFEVLNVSPNRVKISNKVAKEEDTFNETENIEWCDKNAIMVVAPIKDVLFKGEIIWYQGVSVKVKALDCGFAENSKRSNLFWWIKYNKSSCKSGADPYLFRKEYYMFRNELVIELPNVLKEGEGYQFVSLSNGKSFYCDYDDEKPLIYITRKMLDSIGFDGKSIRLKVLYINNYNPPKEITDSMIIINE